MARRSPRRFLWMAALLALAMLGMQAWQERHVQTAVPTQDTSPDLRSVSGEAAPAAPGLPAEALATLVAIERGGPFPYRQDGRVFENRERRLPQRPRGYYREYTVDTPGSPDRGARRIVTGGDPPEVFYYTDDHYRSFRTLEVER